MAVDFVQRAVPGVQQLQPYQPGKPIEELQRELGLTDIVKLASNENPLGMSERAIAAVERALRHDATRYPDGSGFVLKQALSEHLGVAPEQLTLGNGTNELLNIIARVFLNPEDNAVVSQHAFVIYWLGIKAVGATPKVAPAKDWGHDLDAMLAAIDDRTKLVFIANPNNPTGTWLPLADIRRFMEQVPQEVVVVLDEAYFEYVHDSRYGTGLDFLADFPNLIVTRTFSKAYGLAALRVGYAISQPPLADLLNRLRDPFNVNSLAMAAATAVLDDRDYLAKSVAVNDAGLVQLTEGLRALGVEVIPSVTNFVCMEVPGGDAMACYQALLREGVIVRPIGVYEMPRHLRVSVGTEAENATFLTALSKVLSA